MFVALNAWSLTNLFASAPVLCRSSLLFPVNHRKRHIRNDFAGQIISIEAFHRRHERHQTCHPGMHEWVFQTTSKGWNQHFLLGIRSKDGCQAANQDAGICPYRGFGVGLHLREQPKKVIVQYSVG